MNEHITDYLYKYFKLKNPGYAVFIKGEWGCGKTCFIKKYIKEQNKNTNWWGKKRKKLQYISLNGVSSTNILVANILFNAKYALGWVKIIWSLIKCISITGKCITFTPQDLFSSEVFKKLLKRNVLIFDDLERANLDHEKLWGFFSELLEQHHVHIVLVGDESILFKNEKYVSSKEKVIGKTLQIQSNDCEILPEVFKQIEFVNFRPLFQKYHKSIGQIIEEILTVCEKNQTNYRIVKNSCREFIFAFSGIFEDKDLSTKNDEFFEDLFGRFFVISYLLQLGKLKSSEIADVFDIGLLYADKNPNKLVAQKMLQNFDGYFLNPFLTSNMWISIFNHQKIDNKEIISNIKDRINKVIPNWKKLLDFRSCTDQEIKERLQDSLNDISNKKYRDITSILHTFSTLLSMSIEEVIEQTPQEIVIKAKNYIESLGNDLEFEEVAFTINDINDYTAGYSYQAQETEEFNQIRDCLIEKINQKCQQNRQNRYFEFLAKIKNEEGAGRNLYSDRFNPIDIFSNNDPHLLWKKLLELKPKYFNQISKTLWHIIIPDQLGLYRDSQDAFWKKILEYAEDFLSQNSSGKKEIAKCIQLRKYFIPSLKRWWDDDK